MRIQHFLFTALSIVGAAGDALAQRPALASGNRPTSSNNQDSFTEERPVYVTGTVLLSDNSAPAERIKIERVCVGNVQLEGYVDKKGHFSVDIGRGQEVQDATQQGISPFGGLGGTQNGLSSSRQAQPQVQLTCDIRAALPGYRSDAIPLSNIRYIDNPNIGTIVLRRMGNSEGVTVSATSGLASKDAQKAFAKGEDAARKGNVDEAVADFEKAVSLAPKYAAAWYALGFLQEKRNRLEEARGSYEKALAADEKYLPPQLRLAWVAMKESKWPELAERSAKVQQMDATNDPEPYYLSSVAAIQTGDVDLAEAQAREAVKLDPQKKIPRSYYILGLAMAQNMEFPQAAQALRTFLESAPGTSDADLVRKQLAVVEQAVKDKAADAKPAPAQ